MGKLQYAARSGRNTLTLHFEDQEIRLRFVGGHSTSAEIGHPDLDSTQAVLDAMNSINEALAQALIAEDYRSGRA